MISQPQNGRVPVCVVTAATTIDWPLFSWMQLLAERDFAFTVLAAKLPQLGWFARHGVTAVSASTVSEMAADSQLNGRSWPIYYVTSLAAAAEFRQHRQLNGRLLVQATHWELNVLPHLPGGPAQWLAWRPLLAQASRILVITKAQKETAVALGVDPAKLVVIPPGVNGRYFSPQPDGPTRQPGPPLKLLATLSLEWPDGLEYLLHALAHCRAAGLAFHMEIVGYGSEKHRLYYLLDELGLNEMVTPINHLTRAELRQKYRQTDFLLHTNLTDEVAVPTLEAMACGLPVLQFGGANWAELLAGVLPNLLVPVRQTEVLAKALGRLANDPLAFTELRQQVRHWVNDRFSLEAQAAHLDALFVER